MQTVLKNVFSRRFCFVCFPYDVVCTESHKKETPISESFQSKIKYVVLRKITFVFI